jgi:NTE family protein
VRASGSLPPGFPPVAIDGEHYWDGGIVSNTPLWYVLDESPKMDALIVTIDLFHALGELPRNIDEVLERGKDIQYSSKLRFDTSGSRSWAICANHWAAFSPSCRRRSNPIPM